MSVPDGGCPEDGSQALPTGAEQSDEQELKQRNSYLNMRKIFTVTVTEHWNRLL